MCSTPEALTWTYSRHHIVFSLSSRIFACAPLLGQAAPSWCSGPLNTWNYVPTTPSYFGPVHHQPQSFHFLLLCSAIRLLEQLHFPRVCTSKQAFVRGAGCRLKDATLRVTAWSAPSSPFLWFQLVALFSAMAAICDWRHSSKRPQISCSAGSPWSPTSTADQHLIYGRVPSCSSSWSWSSPSISISILSCDYNKFSCIDFRYFHPDFLLLLILLWNSANWIPDPESNSAPVSSNSTIFTAWFRQGPNWNTRIVLESWFRATLTNGLAQ